MFRYAVADETPGPLAVPREVWVIGTIRTLLPGWAMKKRSTASSAWHGMKTRRCAFKHWQRCHRVLRAARRRRSSSRPSMPRSPTRTPGCAGRQSRPWPAAEGRSDVAPTAGPARPGPRRSDPGDRERGLRGAREGLARGSALRPGRIGACRGQGTAQAGGDRGGPALTVGGDEMGRLPVVFRQPARGDRTTPPPFSRVRIERHKEEQATDACSCADESIDGLA
jgi:hypothetical protein